MVVWKTGRFEGRYSTAPDRPYRLSVHSPLAFGWLSYVGDLTDSEAHDGCGQLGVRSPGAAHAAG